MAYRPACLRAVAAVILNVEEARSFPMGQQTTVFVSHTVSAVLTQKGYHWLTPSRFLKYQAVLAELEDGYKKLGIEITCPGPELSSEALLPPGGESAALPPATRRPGAVHRPVPVLCGVSRFVDTDCGVSSAWGRREHSGSRIDGAGSFTAAILRRSNSHLLDRHIGVVPVASVLRRRQRQWRGAQGAARPGRRHRSGCSGLGAKNIQNCHLTLTYSRNVFHSSCFGMGMAVGSSGRTRILHPLACGGM
ncbi:uncharacterized protein LOC116448159 [Corvus moneduloides]|uniref:uncharacterized protein LOC116448159 n=1 Tax=Corvus moneduloides TaxID=1196302 RepID=UPI001362A32B|nr:uncharacterized protein LOC116448159 [Corvus moneduloides]